jgi:hypothetical protein
MLAVELIKLVDVAVCIGAVALTGAVVVQTDIGILNSGNMTNKGSHGTVLSQKVIRSRAKSGWEEVREGVALTREPNRRLQ